MAAGHDFRDWIGRERVAEGTIDLEQARKLAATLDLDPDGLRAGDPLPHGWHWVQLTPCDRRSALGDDGHARRGTFVPPIARERRMWAGGWLRFERRLRIGAPVRRLSTIRSVEHKVGRSGPLSFVRVRHRIVEGDEVAVEEEQELVYLDRTRGRSVRADAEAGTAEGPAGEVLATFTADAVTLFRFSALTFNGHRIHYDRPYATDVEGYPDVVVHGPLLALLLLGAGERALEARRPGAGPGGSLLFRYRAIGPAFRGEEIELRGAAAPDGRALELSARVPGRSAVMTARLGEEG